jgi:DUF1680 family protein
MTIVAKYIVGGIAMLAVVGAVTFRHHSPVCPDDFTTAEEQTAAMVAWENRFFDNNPDGTLSDMAEARHQFYIDNHCSAALERYEWAKKNM